MALLGTSTTIQLQEGYETRAGGVRRPGPASQSFKIESCRLEVISERDAVTSQLVCQFRCRGVVI
jgi:hypothetical protein